MRSLSLLVPLLCCCCCLGASSTAFSASPRFLDAAGSDLEEALADLRKQVERLKQQIRRQEEESRAAAATEAPLADDEEGVTDAPLFIEDDVIEEAGATQAPLIEDDDDTELSEEELKRSFFDELAARAEGRDMTKLYGPYQYLNPMPGAIFVSDMTTVAIKPKTCPVDLSTAEGKVTIRGEQSGRHEGTLKLGDDHCTLVFHPAHTMGYEIVTEGVEIFPQARKEQEKSPPLEYGEKITVAIEGGIKAGGSGNGKEAARETLPAFEWSFNIAKDTTPYSRTSRRRSASRQGGNGNGSGEDDPHAHKDGSQLAFELLMKERDAIMREQRQQNNKNGTAMAEASRPHRVMDPRRYQTMDATVPEIQQIVKTQPGKTADGYIFAANSGFGSGMYFLILDENGEPVFFMPPPAGRADIAEFKVQRNGHLTYRAAGRGGYVELDHEYEEVKVHTAKHGGFADFHGLQVRDDGRALVMVYDRRKVNFASREVQKVVRSGPTRGEVTVVGPVVQEIDTQGNVLFEFRVWDRIPGVFNYTKMQYREGMSLWDIGHVNSIDWTPDGHLIFSFRHIGALKVSRDTGEVLWRFGSEEPWNQFKYLNKDRGFTHQHDVRLRSDKSLTMFDNGNEFSPRYSRAVEYEIDQDKLTAKKVWEYRHDPDYFGFATGNAQKLDNGNWAIDWGGLGSPPMPFYTEVTDKGEKVCELQFSRGGSYRSYRQQWWGQPRTRPELVYKPPSGRSLGSVHYSWNGATNVTEWEVYFGPTHPPTELLNRHPKSMFEHHLPVVGDKKQFFRVVAVDKTGRRIRSSNVLEVDPSKGGGEREGIGGPARGKKKPPPSTPPASRKKRSGGGGNNRRGPQGGGNNGSGGGKQTHEA
ncbi:unnamed protein product [Vitrella brassicaformis CCMP3155]|uniref:Uncharacterized protein n=1 Tax=Vitrella brassicaformis (strain CCMP3155) TaxID=1169540 RepID=A0A0G4E9U4_VITBC|nr:unnamed protein product [Vitrella brassicaformis CCMP3155]|eukprot:CEL92692.1 unnamed protein product [Vitrella brassicaformis CCMP3155]